MHWKSTIIYNNPNKIPIKKKNWRKNFNRIFTHNIGGIKQRIMRRIRLVFLIKITNDINNLPQHKANSISQENRNLHKPKDNLAAKANTRYTPWIRKIKSNRLPSVLLRKNLVRVSITIRNPRKDRRKSDFYKNFIIYL